MAETEATFERFLELLEAGQPTKEPNLTWEELINILGVEKQENGDVDGVKLANACLGVMSNEAVSKLSKEQRIRVIRSSTAALDVLLKGRVK